MLKYNKIYAHKSSGWKELTKENFLWNIFYPRWWNLLFWTLIFFYPIYAGIHYAYCKIDNDGFMSSFFYGVSESSREVCNFLQVYKV